MGAIFIFMQYFTPRSLARKLIASQKRTNAHTHTSSSPAHTTHGARTIRPTSGINYQAEGENSKDGNLEGKNTNVGTRVCWWWWGWFNKGARNSLVILWDSILAVNCVSHPHATRLTKDSVWRRCPCEPPTLHRLSFSFFFHSRSFIAVLRAAPCLCFSLH